MIKWTSRIAYYCLALMVLLFSNICFADIVIGPNTIVSSNKIYIGKTLDMSNGSFVILNNSTLTIKDCTINGTVSPTMPVLIHAIHGNVKLLRNKIHVKAIGITPTPHEIALSSVIRISSGKARISENIADVDQSFSVLFLLSERSNTNFMFRINNNYFSKFHGGLYLLNNQYTNIYNNMFNRVSYANIFLMGKDSNITHNSFLISGNFSDGIAIGVLNATNAYVKYNSIRSGSCVGIALANTHHVLVDTNKIIDQLGYAISIDAPGKETAGKDQENLNLLFKMMRKFEIKNVGSTDIKIFNNYLALNRYGIQAGVVDHLTVKYNLFVQVFPTRELRRFWTDNALLLPLVTNLIWSDNIYKEGYNPINGSDQTRSLQIAVFPATGGVVL